MKHIIGNAAYVTTDNYLLIYLSQFKRDTTKLPNKVNDIHAFINARYLFIYYIYNSISRKIQMYERSKCLKQN